MFNTLTKALCGIVSIIQVIPSFFVFNKPLEIPSYISLFSQWYPTKLQAEGRERASRPYVDETHGLSEVKPTTEWKALGSWANIN